MLLIILSFQLLMSHVFMETHYDNPKQLEITDSSGMKFWHTSTLREYDAGIFPFGQITSSVFVIPPQQPAYTMDAWCPSECTQINYPPAGINITGVTLHTHLSGVYVSLQHFRNGTELPPILEEPYYDFNYQETSMLLNERVVLPGDMLKVRCIYDTSSRTAGTTFGPATQQEMCLAYVTYYPKLPTANESCLYGNYTGLRAPSGLANQSVFCGSTYISNWQGPPEYVAYQPPPCVYNPPPVNTSLPLLVDSLNKSRYDNSAILDQDGKYKMYWHVDRENLLFHAAVEVETTGWVGLGISPNGMEGADVLIGWVKDGQAHFADRFANYKSLPPVDQLQDFYQVSAGQVTSSQAGLSQAAIIGISVGSASAILILLIAIVICLRKTSSKLEYQAMDENEGYGGTEENTNDTRLGKEPVAL